MTGERCEPRAAECGTGSPVFIDGRHWRGWTMATWLGRVADTIVEEFSDLPDAEQITRVCVRLTVAVLLGAAIGYERESRARAAGLRTHMLVALGAALFVLVPLQAGVSPSDLTRVIQGLVAGIGFLGAGAILKVSKTEEIKGLTTAASIWLTAAIGVAAGMGREATAVLCTALALFILAVIPRIFPTPADPTPPADPGA